MKLGSLACLIGCSLVLLIGCGPGGPATVPAKGKITKGGAGVPNVTVSLIDPNNPNNTASGSSDASGAFTLSYGSQGKPGAVPGKYKVVLTGGATNSMMKTGADGKMSYGPGGGAGGASQPPVLDTPYDKKWSSAETSPQDVEVKSGMADIDVKID